MVDSRVTSQKGKGKQRGEQQDDPQDNSQDDPQTLEIDAREAYDAHIMSKIIEYQELNLQDNSLWRAFRADFQNWTVDTFSQCSPGKLENSGRSYDTTGSGYRLRIPSR